MIICIVLEMNVSVNQIVGVGYMHNIPRKPNCTYQHRNVQPDAPPNWCNYTADRRIRRDEFTPEELRTITYFEDYCFFGAPHLARSKGLTPFPVRLTFTLRDKYNVRCHELFASMFNARNPVLNTPANMGGPGYDGGVGTGYRTRFDLGDGFGEGEGEGGENY